MLIHIASSTFRKSVPLDITGYENVHFLHTCPIPVESSIPPHSPQTHTVPLCTLIMNQVGCLFIFLPFACMFLQRTFMFAFSPLDPLLPPPTPPPLILLCEGFIQWKKFAFLSLGVFRYFLSFFWPWHFLCVVMLKFYGCYCRIYPSFPLGVQC